MKGSYFYAYIDQPWSASDKPVVYQEVPVNNYVFDTGTNTRFVAAVSGTYFIFYTAVAGESSFTNFWVQVHTIIMCL